MLGRAVQVAVWAIAAHPLRQGMRVVGVSVVSVAVGKESVFIGVEKPKVALYPLAR